MALPMPKKKSTAKSKSQDEKPRELFSQIEKDLQGLERMHSLQFALIRGLQQQLADLRRLGEG